MNQTYIRPRPTGRRSSRSTFSQALSWMCGVALAAASACVLAQAAKVPANKAPPAKAPIMQVPDGVPQSGEAACGSLENGTAGPFDYRDPTNARTLYALNLNHFSRGVQTLQGGQTTVYVLGDLDFLLRHFPNHHAALQVTARYFLQGGSPLRFRTAECYFDRAIRFAPDDLQVRLLFAMYLQKKGQLQDAIDQVETALALSTDPSMELHYNVALFYIDVKEFQKANYHASVAYAMGYPLPGLRDKLQRLGEWRPVPIQIDDKTGQPVKVNDKTGQAETVASSTKANQ